MQMVQDIPKNNSRIAKANGRSLLPELSRLATNTLDPLLAQLFEDMDVLLSELAASAKSISVEHEYSDLLRELNQRKQRVVEHFQKQLASAFSMLRQQGDFEVESKFVVYDLEQSDSLTLITHEQIERDLIVTELAAKARADWQKELFQLDERMYEIVGSRFDDHDNPFDPRSIARCFIDACEPLTASPAAIRVLHQQFKEIVLSASVTSI